MSCWIMTVGVGGTAMEVVGQKFPDTDDFKRPWQDVRHYSDIKRGATLKVDRILTVIPTPVGAEATDVRNLLGEVTITEDGKRQPIFISSDAILDGMAMEVKSKGWLAAALQRFYGEKAVALPSMVERDKFGGGR